MLTKEHSFMVIYFLDYPQMSTMNNVYAHESKKQGRFRFVLDLPLGLNENPIQTKVWSTYF